MFTLINKIESWLRGTVSASRESLESTWFLFSILFSLPSFPSLSRSVAWSIWGGEVTKPGDGWSNCWLDGSMVLCGSLASYLSLWWWIFFFLLCHFPKRSLFSFFFVIAFIYNINALLSCFMFCVVTNGKCSFNDVSICSFVHLFICSVICFYVKLYKKWFLIDSVSKVFHILF